MTVEGFFMRVAESADVAGVVALERGIAEAPHWAEAEYVAILNKGDGAIRRCFFVAEAEGRLLGFAVGKVIGSDVDGLGELESVAVDAAARRRGVGRALCAAVADWCREQGVAALELEVRAGSGGAIALYAGMGFVVAGRRAGYYREPVEDALLMRLDLGGVRKKTDLAWKDSPGG
jgi:ribosomal-protein-alanine N-acetyltransferase